MQGHIRKRGKGSWTVVVDLGRDPASGKRRQLWRSVSGTKKDAEALLVQLLHQKSAGVDAPPGRITVAEYLQQWLTVYAFPNTAPTTSRRYEQLIRVHLIPTLGKPPAREASPTAYPGRLPANPEHRALRPNRAPVSPGTSEGPSARSEVADPCPKPGGRR